MLPILFIHRADSTFPYSDSSYLRDSVARAKAWNPKSSVYIIGDDSNTKIPLAQHRRVRDYETDAKAFASIYRHFSTNDIVYERFCFERWFILHEFLRVEKISKCLYLDSDVMLYTDVTEQSQRFEPFDFTLYQPLPRNPAAGFCTYVNNRDGLSRLCRYLTERYTKLSLQQEAADFFAEFRRSGQNGGICDMTALGQFRDLGEVPIGDLSGVTEGTAYDVNINASQEYVADEQGKHLEWSAEQPYGRLVATGQPVRFHALHCQGFAKGRMPSLRSQPGENL